jgi:hypothetical protein
MTRQMLLVGALTALFGCNKGADSGKGAAVVVQCADFTTVLADCYAEAGADLSDGGIEAEALCVAEEESGVGSDEYACRVNLIEGSDCSTAEDVALMSEALADCAPE